MKLLKVDNMELLKKLEDNSVDSRGFASMWNSIFLFRYWERMVRKINRLCGCNNESFRSKDEVYPIGTYAVYNRTHYLVICDNHPYYYQSSGICEMCREQKINEILK